MAPNNLIIKKTLSFSFINAETPNASKVVWTIHPLISPAVVERPYFVPLAILCVKTKILSGPGAMARADVARIKAESIS